MFTHNHTHIIQSNAAQSHSMYSHTPNPITNAQAPTNAMHMQTQTDPSRVV